MPCQLRKLAAPSPKKGIRGVRGVRGYGVLISSREWDGDLEFIKNTESVERLRMPRRLKSENRQAILTFYLGFLLFSIASSCNCETVSLPQAYAPKSKGGVHNFDAFSNDVMPKIDVLNLRVVKTRYNAYPFSDEVKILRDKPNNKPDCKEIMMHLSKLQR